MRLVSYLHNDSTHVGVLNRESGTIVKFSDAFPGSPNDMLAVIELLGTEFSNKIPQLDDKPQLAVQDVTVLAPIPRPPRNIICVGKNYPDHVNEVKSIVASSDESKGAVPEHPIIFTKAPGSVIGCNASIPAHLDYTDSVDYEGELAVVIGKSGRNISRKSALNHVFGYTIVNDVTSRRLQKKHQQWFLGKSIDGFCPMGPVILTQDEVEDVTRLRIKTYVNNDLRQDGVVGDMLFDIPALIESISSAISLNLGDIIATGTPAGVGMGFKPPRFLTQGDTVSIEIEPIGTLINTVQ